jgi:hypothetical protein
MVNGVRIQLGWSRTASRRMTYRERGLGLDITAAGPRARRVLATLTHSPLSVVLKSAGLTQPADWRRVTFGGLQFSVPSQWQTERRRWWGGCPGNLAPGVVVLSTAQVMSAPSCPAPLDTAGLDAGAPGMVVGAGPMIADSHRVGETCGTHNGLRACIYPPPLHGGESSEQGLQILAATVYLHDRRRPDYIELGLSGSGQTPAIIFDSLEGAR